VYIIVITEDDMTNTTNEKNAAISTAILSAYIVNGDFKSAFDKVIGNGAFDKLAGEIYDELRKK